MSFCDTCPAPIGLRHDIVIRTSCTRPSFTSETPAPPIFDPIELDLRSAMHDPSGVDDRHMVFGVFELVRDFEAPQPRGMQGSMVSDSPASRRPRMLSRQAR